jgi:hypothetical protein
MAKISVKKLKEYQEFESNGFKIHIGSLLIGYSDYPQIFQNIFDKDNIGVDITISYYKGYKAGRFRIVAEEYIKQGNLRMSGTGYFSKTYYHKEAERYSFKDLKALCNHFKIEDFKKEILTDYENWKLKGVS